MQTSRNDQTEECELPTLTTVDYERHQESMKKIKEIHEQVILIHLYSLDIHQIFKIKRFAGSGKR